MSEFPRGEAPGNPDGGEDIARGAGRSAAGAESRAGGAGTETASAAGTRDRTGDGAGAGEAGFENAPGTDALPSMEDTQASAAGGASGEGRPGSTDTPAGQAGVNIPGLPGLPGGAPRQGAPASNGSDGTGGGAYGRNPGQVVTVQGRGQGSGRDTRQNSRSGTLTPGEQVAILDGKLERSMGEFDTMILEEQAARRRAQREQGQSEPTRTASAAGAVEGESGKEGGFGREIGGGRYSVGGGMGGVGSGRAAQNTAKYPPPSDIPSGNDDDVVARQLREAAMREPDPAVREKLWAEYRKYKGIKQP